jgi:hypothetical protein
MATMHIPYKHLKYYGKWNAQTYLNAIMNGDKEVDDRNRALCGFHLYNEKQFFYTASEKLENLLKVKKCKKLKFFYVDAQSYRVINNYPTWDAYFANNTYRIVMESYWDTIYYHVYNINFMEPEYIGTAHNHIYVPAFTKCTPVETYLENTTLKDISGCEIVHIELDLMSHVISVDSTLTSPR